MRGPHGIRLRPNRKIDAQGDVPVGAVIKAAVRQGLSVESVSFPRGAYLDIGTPADLRKAVRTYR
jgi:glucose-1-phosphate thymidylyltransferase